MSGLQRRTGGHVAGRRAQPLARARIYMRKFRPEKQDLRGVEDPEKDDDERGGGAVTGGECAVGNIKAEQEFAGHEKNRCQDRARQYVAPRHPSIWQVIKKRRKKEGDDS